MGSCILCTGSKSAKKSHLHAVIINSVAEAGCRRIEQPRRRGDYGVKPTTQRVRMTFVNNQNIKIKKTLKPSGG